LTTSENPFFNINPYISAVPSNIPDISVNGKELFTTMMAETARLDPHIFLAIQKLKGNS
jgi:hypothetical protein